jgi:hypothetical protein
MLSSSEESVLRELFARLHVHDPVTPPSAVREPAMSKTGPAVSSGGEEAALKSLFAMLNSDEFREASNKVKKVPIANTVDVNPFSEERSNVQGDHKLESATTKEPVSAVESNEEWLVEVENLIKQKTEQLLRPVQKANQEYLRQAVEVTKALPDIKNGNLQMIKTVTAKLEKAYAIETVGDKDVDKIKARFAFAIVTHVNKVYKKNAQPMTTETAQKALRDAGGDISTLWSQLVDTGYLPFYDLDTFNGLCKAMLDVLPKAELIGTPTTPMAESKPASKDPMDGMKVWPTQEKRVNCK